MVSLRVQGPDDDQTEDVDTTEEVECFLVEFGEDRGEQECRPPIANTPANHAPGVTTSADLKREDLGRVQPRHGQPRSSKNGGKEENEERCGSTEMGLVRARGVECSTSETARGETTYPLADGAPVEGPAPTDSIEGENTN